MKNTIDEAIAVLTAFKEGKTIQYNAGFNDWVDCGNYSHDQSELLAHLRQYQFRIKPTPKLVPLEMNDIPPVCWVRFKEAHNLITGISADESGSSGLVYFSGAWRGLMGLTDHEYSTDRVNWKPMSKEASV